MHSKQFQIVILIYLLSVFCIPSTLGLYKRGANSTGSVNAATWSVALNQTGISGSVTATAGDANGSTYLLKVVSNSEVDVDYSITISNIPSDVVVSLNNYNNGAFQTPTNGTVTFTNAGTINYTGSSEEVTRTLTFKAASGAATVNNQTVTINVDFKQAQ